MIPHFSSFPLTAPAFLISQSLLGPISSAQCYRHQVATAISMSSSTYNTFPAAAIIAIGVAGSLVFLLAGCVAYHRKHKPSEAIGGHSTASIRVTDIERQHVLSESSPYRNRSTPVHEFTREEPTPPPPYSANIPVVPCESPLPLALAVRKPNSRESVEQSRAPLLAVPSPVSPVAYQSDSPWFLARSPPPTPPAPIYVGT